MSAQASAPHTPPEALGESPGRRRLEGRRVLVVGAGQREVEGAEGKVGNGRAIAALAAREGAAVACADLELEAAQGTVDMIAATGGHALAIAADASDPADCERTVAEAHAALGGLDGLVLNVGVLAPLGLEATSGEDWDRTFAVNLKAHFLATRAALPRMSEGGSIVFSGSVAGQRPGSMLPAYDASKAGIFGLCRHVAQEGAPRRIRANTVVFGIVDTPLGVATAQGRPSRGATPIPLGRQGTPWEMAYAALFLLSDEASYVTAQELVVDAGLTVLSPLPG